MKTASGRSVTMAMQARRLAATACLMAVTKARSLRSSSFHSPSRALIRAQTYNSLTGVKWRTQP